MEAYCHFDWFTGSVDNSPENLIALFRSAGEDFAPCKGNPRYDASIQVHKGGDRLARISWGRNYSYPLVESSGRLSSAAIDLIRSSGFTAFPSRLDAALDLLQTDKTPFSFERMANIAIETAERVGVQVSNTGDWLGSNPGQKGRTLYIGSRQSSCFYRLYEKGKEQGIPGSDWVRFECEYKPRKHEKPFAIHLAPYQVLSHSRFASELLRSIGFEPDQIKFDKPPRSRRDASRARYWLVSQYMPTILDWLDDVGSADDLLADMFRLHEKQQPQKERSHDHCQNSGRNDGKPNRVRSVHSSPASIGSD